MVKLKIMTDKSNTQLNDEIMHSIKNKVKSNNVKVYLSNPTLLEVEHSGQDPLLYGPIATTIVNYIVENIEKSIIKELVSEECYGLPEDYIEEAIEKIQWELLYKDDPKNIERVKTLYNDINKIIEKENLFNLKGFLKFRFTERFIELTTLVFTILEDFLNERTIDDFVSVVKKLVRIQMPKTEYVHILPVEDSMYKIVDNEDEIISLKELNESLDNVNSDIEYEITNYELLVSALLSLLPEKVYFHSTGSDEDNKVFSVLKKIYEGRCTKCEGCDICE